MPSSLPAPILSSPQRPLSLSAPFGQTGPNGGPMFSPVWPNEGPSFGHVWPNGGPWAEHGPQFGQTWPSEGPSFGQTVRTEALCLVLFSRTVTKGRGRWWLKRTNVRELGGHQAVPEMERRRACVWGRGHC